MALQSPTVQRNGRPMTTRKSPALVFNFLSHSLINCLESFRVAQSSFQSKRVRNHPADGLIGPRRHSSKEPDPDSPHETLATTTASDFSPIQPLVPLTPSNAAPHPQSTQSSLSMANPPPSLKSPGYPRRPDQSIGAYLPGLEQYQTSSRASETISRNSSPMKNLLHDESIGSGTSLTNQVQGDRHDNPSTEPVPAPTEFKRKSPKQQSDETERSLLGKESDPIDASQTTHLANIYTAELEVKAETLDSLVDPIQSCLNQGISNQSVEVDLSLRTSPKPSETSMETVPSRAVTGLKNDIKYQPCHRASEASTRSPSANPKTPQSRKRPAPKPKSGKKGTASAIQRGAKRRKIDGSSDGTPSVQRSGTPASSRASKTPAPKNRKQQSVTPGRSSSPIDPDDDGEEDEEAALFCVCRKPDDHTVMIACDGPCQDWFHGRCVGINEKDGNLIDKYICPNCKLNGNGQTIWKRMCRLETCRNPARVNDPTPSKYCSDAHGLEYMRIRHTKRDLEETKPSTSCSPRNRKRRRDNYTDNFGDGDDDVGQPEDSNTLRGGVLRGLELKTLANGVKNVAELRQLGEGVLSPTQTASLENGESNGATNKHFNPSESQQLAEIANKKGKLEARKHMLEHRDRFLHLVKSRAKRVLDELRKTESVKDICGFDSRLSWSDEEFLAWSDSPEGQQALKTGVLTAAPSTDTITDGEIQNDGGEEHTVEVGRGVCQKRRCERHRTWWKLQQQDILFEKGEVRLALGKLGGEEEGVRKRAVVRRLEEC